MQRSRRRSSSSNSSKINPMDPLGSSDFVSSELNTFVPLFQRLNREQANWNLIKRQHKRAEAYAQRTAITQQEIGPFEQIAGWLYDYIIYVLEIVWGYITPIFSMLFWGLLRGIIILALYALMFFALFWLLFK